MAKKTSFDPNKFEYYRSSYYYDGKRASSYRIKQYKRYLKGGNSNRVTTVPKQYQKYFSSGTNWTTRQGHLKSWANPLNLKGGKNPTFNWSRVAYGENAKTGKVLKTNPSSKWGADIRKGGKGLNNTGNVLNGSAQWIRHIQISMYQLRMQAANFRVLVGQRAIKVFQNSFKYKKFYSNRTRQWTPLSDATLKKRAKRGTGSSILKEYGDLLASIKIKEQENPITTRVYTDVVPADSTKHKKHSICYAGYHNEGKGTYGSAWNGHKPRKYIRRQFMGHSSYLNPYSDPFMRKMVKLYLFDSVFLMQKT